MHEHTNARTVLFQYIYTRARGREFIETAVPAFHLFQRRRKASVWRFFYVEKLPQNVFLRKNFALQRAFCVKILLEKGSLRKKMRVRIAYVRFFL